jgi:putative flippase GtrA
VRFALVGAAATAAQYAILIVLVREAGVSPTPASAIGFVVSAIGNYLLNYYFTFRSRRSHGGALAKFLLLAGGGLAINSLLMQLLVVGAGWYYMVAQVCATAVVFLWNFIGNSFWTFGAPERVDAR